MKVGILLPMHYEGGTFRLAKLYAKMLRLHAMKTGADLQVVFGNTEGKYDPQTDLRDLAELGIEIRHLEMRQLSAEQGLEYVDFLKLRRENLEGFRGQYAVPYDRGNGYMDCDFWFFMVDRIFGTVLPLKPFGIFATDFIQRYVPDIFEEQHYAKPEFLTTLYRNFRNADLAFASTPGTARDLLSYVGRAKRTVVLDTLFDDSFIKHRREEGRKPEGDYFVWATNGTIHKNHERALKALILYYEKHGGTLECRVTGVHTRFFDPSAAPEAREKFHPYHRKINEMIAASPTLRSRVRIMGNMGDSEYQDMVAGSRFLWHNVLADNGTFSVIEAACMGIRSLSSRYPQQEFIDRSFGLGMKLFDPFDIVGAARALREMQDDGSIYVPPVDRLRALSQDGASARVGAVIHSAMIQALEESRHDEFIP